MQGCDGVTAALVLSVRAMQISLGITRMCVQVQRNTIYGAVDLALETQDDIGSGGDSAHVASLLVFNRLCDVPVPRLQRASRFLTPLCPVHQVANCSAGRSCD